jgi:uncharacterized protein YPO0396
MIGHVDLPTMALILTGAVVPLLIYLLSRGPQLRQIKTTAETNLAATATALAEALQNQVKILEDKITQLEKERSEDRANFVRQLNRAHDENERISILVAQTQTDLDITTRQIAELKSSHKRLEMAIEDSATAQAAMREGQAQIATAVAEAQEKPTTKPWGADRA